MKSPEQISIKEPLSFELQVFKNLQETLKNTLNPLIIEGLQGSSKGYFLSQIWKKIKKPILVVTADQISAEVIFGDLKYYLKREKQKIIPQFFPTWEILPFEPLSPLLEISAERLSILHKLLQNQNLIVVTPVEAIIQKLLPKEVLKNHTFTINQGETLDRELLEYCFVDNGLEHTQLVDGPAQFSSRGDILDVFLPTHPNPVRIEFFGDQVESIRHFDVNSQISIDEIDEVTILPIREVCLNEEQIKKGTEKLINLGSENEINKTHMSELLEKVEGLKFFSGLESLAPFFYENMQDIFDYISSETLIIQIEKDAIQEKISHYQEIILEEHGRCLERGEVIPDPDSLFFLKKNFSQKLLKIQQWNLMN